MAGWKKSGVGDAEGRRAKRAGVPESGGRTLFEAVTKADIIPSVQKKFALRLGLPTRKNISALKRRFCLLSGGEQSISMLCAGESKSGVMFF